jgi:hypothetical protein
VSPRLTFKSGIREQASEYPTSGLRRIRTQAWCVFDQPHSSFDRFPRRTVLCHVLISYSGIPIISYCNPGGAAPSSRQGEHHSDSDTRTAAIACQSAERAAAANSSP